MYAGYVTTIRKIRKHSNADRLQVVTVYENDVIVDLKFHEGQKVVFFPVDGQLSEEYCADNNLVRKLDENGNNIGGYLDPDKRNIRAIRLRGEKSEGLIMPIETLSKYINVETLKDGFKVQSINDHEICRKYIPNGGGNCVRRPRPKGSKRKVEAPKISYPYFMEHVDTEQLVYNQDAFRPGDTIYLTLKMHGTSARTANTLEVTKKKPNFFRRLLRAAPKETRKWDVVSGTRRVTLMDYGGGYYGSNEFRKKYTDFFAPRLPKGLTVFYEIVGYTNGDNTIMGRCKNALVKDKEFSVRYGAETVFSYGCNPGENAAYVYRMTWTNEDGDVFEVPWEEVKRLSERMGVAHVPEFEKFIFTTWEDLLTRVEKYYDGDDPIGKTHIREGVVVRIDNRPSFTAYKHKNFYFKVLEGIIKDASSAPDMEEAQDVEEGIA